MNGVHVSKTISDLISIYQYQTRVAVPEYDPDRSNRTYYAESFFDCISDPDFCCTAICCIGGFCCCARVQGWF